MHATWQFHLFRRITRALLWCLLRVRVEGLENVPRTPYIACVNHLGWAEGFIVMLWFPPEPLIHGLGERDVMERSAFRRWFFKQVPIFLPLERDKPRQAVRAMQDVLQRGGALGLAPEGKLGTQEGALGELQAGAAYLSIRTGAPLVPVGATGTLELWLWKKVTLRVGKAILPGEFAGDFRTRTRAMTRRLDRELRALLPGDAPPPRVKLLRNFLTKLF
ncbi:MAG: 1-acyl-sn-glycerol-3-phosphate acyltransferase [Chloroflexi bacterium]|nr:1-acyl-sn-glycerol-3-phosphate acyltransferase [Chloroflexota bacterium]